jgi:hypothetical protein
LTDEEEFNERWPDYDYTVSTCAEEDYESLGDCLVVPMPKPDYYIITGTGPEL